MIMNKLSESGKTMNKTHACLPSALPCGVRRLPVDPHCWLHFSVPPPPRHQRATSPVGDKAHDLVRIGRQAHALLECKGYKQQNSVGEND